MTHLEPVKEMANGFYDTKEWFDNDLLERASSIPLPEPDEDYFYFATHLLSWFPYVNDRGATYEREDFSDDLLDTLVGKQVNLYHDKGRVVGTVIARDMNNYGIDIGVRVDREQASLQGLDPEDLKQGNYFSAVSVELTKNPDESKFYQIDDGYNIKNVIPVPVGRKMGIRRTTKRDPYLFQGARVAERIKPARFTGVGIVPNPSDKTAQLYAVAASEDSEERPIPPLKTQTENAETHDPTASATDANTSHKETFMSDQEIQDLQGRVAELERHVGDLTKEKETASSERDNANARVAELETALASKETELAAAIAERDQLKSEKEIAAREKSIDELVGELEAIHPAADDTERAALREQAASACDDSGVIRVLKLEREVKAKDAKIAALETAKPAEAAPAATDATAATTTTETKPEDGGATAGGDATTTATTEGSKETAASGEREKFSAEDRPAIGIGGTYVVKTPKGEHNTKDLLDAF